MKRHLQLLIQTAAAALLLFSCDRERSNPLDPQADAMIERPSTPAGLVAEPGVSLVRLLWQAVENRDLAGYAVYRAVRSDGEYDFIPGEGDSTLQITTGKTSFVDSVDAAGATFFYRVAAVDTTGLHSELSGFVGATVLEDKVPPQAPQNLSVVAAENAVDRVVVRWSLPRRDADGRELTGLQGFVLFRAEGGTGGFVPIDTLAANAQEYVDGDLKALTVYAYTILAFDNAENQSELAQTQQASTRGLAVPAALRAEGKIGRIELNWQAIDVTELLGYEVYRSTRSDTGFELLPSREGTSFTTGQTTYVDSSLSGGQLFFYKVQAVVEGEVTSELSGFVSATAEADEVPPAVPSNLSSVPDEEDFGKVTLNWNAPIQDANGGDLTGLVGYVVFRSEETTDSFIRVDQVTETSYEDTGLEESKVYYYTVTALDGADNESGRASSVRVKTKGADKVGPESPQNVSAVPDEVDFGRVVVRWSAPAKDADGGDLTGLSGYVVFRSEGGTSSFVPVETLAAEEREYADTGLEPLTTYFYTVIALDEAGNESRRAASVQVKTEGLDKVGPESPQNVSAVPDEVDFGRVVVRWSAPAKDTDGGELTGLVGYIVTRADEGSTTSFAPLDTLDAEVREYVDTGLRPLTTYTYIVLAIDEALNASRPSAFSQVTTRGVSVPAALRAEGKIGRIELNWQTSDDVDLLGFNIYRSMRSDTGFELLPSREGTSFTTGQTTYVDSSLSGGQLFFYKVQAVVEGEVTSELSGFVSATAEADEVPPAVPSNLSSVPDEEDFGKVTLNWNAPIQDANGGDLTGLVGYVVFRSEETTDSFIRVDQVTETSYEDTGLEESKVYYYTVTALDGADNESGRASSVRVKTKGADKVGPESPQNVSAVPDEVDFGRVVVRWSAPSKDADGGDLTGLTGYVVFRSEGGTSSFVPVDTLAAGVREYADTGLEPLTTYAYTVIALDEAENESRRAASVQVKTKGPDKVGPESPQNVSAVPDEVDFGRVVVRWSAPAKDADGGELTGLTGYVVFRSEGGTSSFVPVDTLSTDVREYADTGLRPLTTYAYTVIAFDETGNESRQSSPTQTRTQGVSVPAGLSAAGEIGRIELSWQASGDEDLSGYNVYRSTRSDQGYELLPSREGTSFTTGQTTYVDSNLTGGQLFFYEISAVISQTESEHSVFVSAVAEADESAPAAPADLAAIADASAARITLSWSAPATDGSGGELTGLASYIVSRSKDDASSFVAVDTLAEGETRLVDADLEASTLYFYTVSAVDPDGNTSSRSSAVSARTAGIAAPSGVSATSGIKLIVVSWQASDDEDLFGYNVYRSTRSDQGYERLPGIEGTSYTTGQTAYIDSGLTGSLTFFYQISVVTSAGESERSAFDGATVQSDARAPGRPSFVDGSPVEGNPEQLSIDWKAPTADLTGEDLTGLSRYLIYRSDSVDGKFELIGESATNAFVDTGLVAQTTYYYQIEASDEDGNVSPRSTTAILTTGGVDIPENVRLSATTPSSLLDPAVVTIRWEASSGAIIHYEVQRTTVANSTDDADYEEILPNTRDTFRDDETVTRGTTYYYRVRSRDVDDRASDWTELLSVEVKN